MADPLTDLGSMMGFGGIQVDALTQLVMQSLFGIGIIFVVAIFLWKTKWYKRIVHSYPIITEILDTRAGNTYLKYDKLGKTNKEGVIKGEFLKSGDTIDFPAIKDLMKDDKGREHYKVQRVDLGIYVPVRYDISNPDSKLVSSFKDLRHAMNMQKLLQRELKVKYTMKSMWASILPILPAIAVGIMVLLVLYANYTYLWLPMAQRVDTESLMIKEIASVVKDLQAGNTGQPQLLPANYTPPS